MTKGNEKAIDLGLELVIALHPCRSVPLEIIVAYCDSARQIVGGSTKSFRKQDFWHLEKRALLKMRTALKSKGINQPVDLLEII